MLAWRACYNMPKDKSYLPISRHLDTVAFGRMLDRATNSYKFLWCGAVVDFVQKETAARQSRGLLAEEIRIPFKSLVAEVLVAAHHPLWQFRLSFGKQDMMRQHAAALDGDSLPCEEPDAVAARYRGVEIPKPVYDDIVKYVPYRLLTPFFDNELKGLLDREKNAKIEALAKRKFGKGKPPFYRFDGEHVIVHPKWADYIADNLQVVCAWHELRWLNYLQGNNPSVPGIASKLTAPPKVKKGMPKARTFWQGIIAEQDIRCIYSGTKLSAVRDIVLDHYVPWNFYAHNQLWNLVPTTPGVNSAKSDSLPDKKYYKKFLQLQHIAARVLAKHPHKWKTLREEYETGLADADGREDFGNLTKFAHLKRRYDMVVLPAIQLAKARGFASNWKHGEKLL